MHSFTYACVGGRDLCWRSETSVWKLFAIPFQGELQEAISAHAAREQTAVYSDDFESEEVDMLNGKTELKIFTCFFFFCS